MNGSEIRGYVIALSLLGFSGAWAATAREVPPKDAVDPEVKSALEKQDAMLTAREKQLAVKAKSVRRLIAQRRADAKKPRPVRYVRVYSGGGGGVSSGGGGGGSSSGGGGGSVSGPAPVTITPVVSSGSS